MNWNNHERIDGSIDLVGAWLNDGQCHFLKPESKSSAQKYLELVSAYTKITSPQAAAIALATADYIALTEDTK